MCTVTVIPTPRGLRLVCNRDEQRSRPKSTAQKSRILGSRTALFPIDPASNGTWIGANDVGLVACLLNSNPGQSRTPASRWSGRESRGVIVPMVLHGESLEDALALLTETDAGNFPPFRLVIIREGCHSIVTSDGAGFDIPRPSPLRSPILLTSSGLGDALADSYRRPLFCQAFRAGASPSAQDGFHAHSWPECSHLSVQMSRPDARTVSRTAVDIASDGIEIRHAWLGDDLSESGSSSSELPTVSRLHAA